MFGEKAIARILDKSPRSTGKMARFLEIMSLRKANYY